MSLVWTRLLTISSSDTMREIAQPERWGGRELKYEVRLLSSSRSHNTPSYESTFVRKYEDTSTCTRRASGFRTHWFRYSTRTVR